MSEIRKLTAEADNSRDEALEALFSNMPKSDDMSVELPSKGKFYKEFSEVVVSPLSFTDEEAILNTKGKGSNIINMLLEKSIKGVSVPDLILMDKFYLLMKLREASYGDDYSFEIPCPHCEKTTRTEMKISQNLNIRFIPDDFEDPRKVKLPKLGVDVEVRFPRVREESFLEDPITASRNLYRFVVSIDGNKDPVFISKALDRMHIQDVKKIAKEVTMDQFGVDPRFLYECQSCGETSLLQIPLGADFFSVS